ncbi:MAG TPA: CoA transferase, partial [Acidimicrobiales bacterium]
TAGPRSRHAAQLWEILDPVIATRKTDELVTALRDAGVPCAVVHPLESLHEDPQIVANDFLVVVDDPRAGRMRTTRPVGDLSGASLRSPTAAPGLGEHTTAVLSEIGYGDDEIAAMREAGVVG